jgi:hypothetical protein
MTRRRSITEELIAVQSMLKECALKVARAETNLRQESGGFSATTPGNGSPGGGKGGGPTVRIADPSDPVTTHHVEFVDLPDGTVERRPFSLTTTDAVVPVTSVEQQAIFAGRDDAAADLRRLLLDVLAVADALDLAARLAELPLDYRRSALERPTVTVLRSYGCATELINFGALPPEVAAALASVHRTTERLFRIVQRWAYIAGRATVAKDVAEILAEDLTERWCRSHLRLGVKRPRYRGELCQWCTRTAALVATWEVPPLELVRLHVDHGKVYAHQFEEFARAERDRQRNLATRARKK